MEKGAGEEKVCMVEFLSVVARRDDFGETGRGDERAGGGGGTNCGFWGERETVPRVCSVVVGWAKIHL